MKEPWRIVLFCKIPVYFVLLSWGCFFYIPKIGNTVQSKITQVIDMVALKIGDDVTRIADEFDEVTNKQTNLEFTKQPSAKSS